jgi:predicted Zn-dependent protease
MRALLAAATTLVLAAALPAQPRSPFVLSKNDLKVLSECDAIDRRFETRALIFHDTEIEAHLSELAAPLLPAQVPEHVAWNFHILRNPAAMAFALPNGSIYLSVGLLARTENDDQVFGTLAHEIAHVTERHAYLSMRSIHTAVTNLRLFSVGSYFFVGVYGTVLTDWVVANREDKGLMEAVLGYRKDYEEGADQRAVEQMKQAGRDPIHLIRLAVVLDEKIDPQPIPLLHTDIVALRDRIQYLKRLTSADHDPGPEVDGRYVDRMGAVFLQTIALALNTRQYRSAAAASQRLASARPNNAGAEYWLGESYRSLGPRGVQLTEQELKPEAQRAALRQEESRAEVVEEARLAQTPEGKAALTSNQQKAEELFRKASELDPSMPEPYFGLGLLYEQEGKKENAAEAYRKYISVCTRESDRQRASRRLDELAAHPTGNAK